jgi:hypothetical protein
MPTSPRDVRFTLESGHSPDRLWRPLCANRSHASAELAHFIAAIRLKVLVQATLILQRLQIVLLEFLATQLMWGLILGLAP